MSDKKKTLPLHPHQTRGRSRKLSRKVGRVIDRAGLEIRYTLFGYRGFESLTFRNKKRETKKKGFSFLYRKNGYVKVRLGFIYIKELLV